MTSTDRRGLRSELLPRQRHQDQHQEKLFTKLCRIVHKTSHVWQNLTWLTLTSYIVLTLTFLALTDLGHRAGHLIVIPGRWPLTRHRTLTWHRLWQFLHWQYFTNFFTLNLRFEPFFQTKKTPVKSKLDFVNIYCWVWVKLIVNKLLYQMYTWLLLYFIQLHICISIHTDLFTINKDWLCSFTTSSCCCT